MSAALLLLFGSAKTISPPAYLDLTTTGVKDIGTQTSAGTFSAFLLQIFCSSIVGFVSNPVVSIGTNSPNYDNIYSSLPFDFFSGDLSNTFQNLNISNGSAIENGTAIKANVTVAAVATTYTANISLSGVVQ